MKKKIFLLTTFIISFVMFTSNVSADEDIALSCLYKGHESGIFKAQGTTLITQSTSGTISVYYIPKSTKFNDNYSELYNYPIKNAILYQYDKVEGKDDLKVNSGINHEDQFQKKGCPTYVDYNSKNVRYTYDIPENKESFSSYYPLTSTDIISKSSSNTTKELKCTYPALSYQKELIITQSTDGKKTITYGGETKDFTLNNDEENTGYDKSTGKFNSCPVCADAHSGYINFYNGEEDGTCKTSYSGTKNSEDQDWEHICTYGPNDQYTPFKKIELSYNKNNFEVLFDIENPNIDESKVQINITATELWKNNSNECPDHLKLYNYPQSDISKLSLDDSGGIYFSFIAESKKKPGNPSVNKPEPKDCEALFENDVIEIINDVMKIVRIAVPILLLVFGITDFFRATFANGEEDIKKARERFIKRIIAAIIVFIVPFFVNLVLNLANKAWSDINPETCIRE